MRKQQKRGSGLSSLVFFFFFPFCRVIVVVVGRKHFALSRSLAQGWCISPPTATGPSLPNTGLQKYIVILSLSPPPADWSQAKGADFLMARHRRRRHSIAFKALYKMRVSQSWTDPPPIWATHLYFGISQTDSNSISCTHSWLRFLSIYIYTIFLKGVRRGSMLPLLFGLPFATELIREWPENFLDVGGRKARAAQTIMTYVANFVHSGWVDEMMITSLYYVLQSSLVSLSEIQTVPSQSLVSFPVGAGLTDRAEESESEA